MFEMFITALAAAAVAFYGFSRSVFMTGPYQFYYRCGLGVILLIIFLYVTGRRWLRHHRIKSMNVDFTEYMYYEKFTSPLYRAGYFISYFVMNLLFDYNYMRRNFNYCKGLDVYDKGVGEYYIKFRNTWYRYLALTIKRHQVSIKKLQSYAAQTQNDMILKALDDDEKKAICLQFAKDAEEAFNQRRIIGEHVILPLSNYDKVPRYYKDNLVKIFRSRLFLEKNEPEVKALVDLMERHSQKDVNDFKKTIY